MDKLSCINTFIEIVEQGNLHKAAKKLHQTDAAVSKKLTKLENSLNVTLLERGNGLVKLTTIGQQYYTLCKEATNKILSANQLIDQTKAIPRGILKVGCAKFHAQQSLMPKLRSFLELYPEVRITLNIAERIPDIMSGEVDILYGVATPINDHDSRLIRKKLGQTRDILCASPAYLKTIRIPKKPQDLTILNYVCHAMRPHNLLNFDNEIEIQIQPFLVINNNEMVVNVLLQDLGFTSVKEYLVKDYLDSGKLIEILPKYRKTISPICAYYRYQEYPDPKIQAFIKHFSG